LTLSLRARLLLWLILPLAVFVAVTAMISYDSASSTASVVQDAALLSSARTIGEDIDWVEGRLTANVPPAALEIFESPYQDQVFYKIVADKQLLGGDPDLALPSREAAQPVFYDSTLDGRNIRVVAYTRQLYDSGKIEPVKVVVGKTQASHHAMLEQLWRPHFLRECLMLALVATLVPLGLTVELRPLMKLKNNVADREPMQIEPMRAEGLPWELRPIVDAINQCIAQLKVHTARQRQFIADAAHQLRTPLTLLDTQIQYASLREHRDLEVAAALDGMRRSTQKMTDMTNQLLLLAQAEAAPAHDHTRVDLSAVVASVLEELVVVAHRRGIDLGAEFAADVHVEGNANLLHALVANLIDNAIRYTQNGGRVTASCTRQGDDSVLQIIDNGPGIPAEARVHVFERFYRGTTRIEGTGLGLSIVREIAQLHGGAVAVGHAQDSRGLVVTVRMPASRS
jgi:two-component system sensor histidine kinase TctE